MRRCLRSIIAIFVLMIVFASSVAPAVGQRYPPYTPFVAWNPNGQFLAVGHDTTLTILDANTLEVVNSLNNLEMQDVSAAWSPDGNRLAIVNGPDLEVWEQVWSDVDAQRSMVYGYYNDLEPPVSREGNIVSLAAIAWNPDGSELAVCPGGAIYIIDASTGLRVRRLYDDWGNVTDLDWFADDRFALSAVFNRFGYVVDAFTGSILNYFYTDRFTQMSSYVISVAFSPDGNNLVVGTNDGIIALWSNTQAAVIDNDTPDFLFRNLGDQRHSGRVDALEWSPTGQYIATGSQDGTIRLWDAVTGEQLHVINLGEDAWVFSLAWSPDGSKLVYGNADGSVTLFDATQLPGYEPMTEASSND